MKSAALATQPPRTISMKESWPDLGVELVAMMDMLTAGLTKECWPDLGI